MGLFEPHVERIRDGYREKLTRHAARRRTDYLARWTAWRGIVRSGGLYVWLRLPEANRYRHGRARCSRRRSAKACCMCPGEYCYPGEGQPVRRNTIRLSFGVQSCAKIRKA